MLVGSRGVTTTQTEQTLILYIVVFAPAARTGLQLLRTLQHSVDALPFLRYGWSR
jgi:hypothetical protein